MAQTAEIADGWLPLYSPFRNEVYSDAIKQARSDFEVAQGIVVNITDDKEKGFVAGEGHARPLRRRHGR